MATRAWWTLPHPHLVSMRDRALFAVAAALALLASMNAWIYSAAAAGPLVQADSWYFLDVFLSKYFEGNLRIADLFVQREPGDHSQPLQKLILLFHTRFFDLDFRIEGLIAVAIGITWCSVLASGLCRAAAKQPHRHPAAPLAIALLFLLGLSLNATNIFTWSLVTLSYLPLLIGTVFFLALWRWGTGPCFWLMAPAGFLLGMLLDEVAIIVVVAALMSLTLLSMAPLRIKLRTAALLIAGLVLGRLLLWYVSMYGWEGGVPDAPSLLSVLFTREALRGLLIPFGDSLIYIEHLQRLFPEQPLKASIIVALCVLALHAWFWFRAAITFIAVRAGRQVPNLSTVALAVFLMLVSYALIAGIVYGRVPTHGWGYLHQPRYIMYYQLGLMAVVMMFHTRLTLPSANTGGRWAWIGRLAMITIMLVLMITQVLVSRISWDLPKYLTPYWQNAALSMQKLAEDPENLPPCPDIMSVCVDYDAEGRARLMGLLVQHQLNIFSPAFQMRNRLYPTLHSIPGFGPPPASADADADVLPSVAIEVSRLSEGCVEMGARSPVRIRLVAGDMPVQELQLWVDALGTPRTRLAPLESVEGAVEMQSELLPGSVLGVVRGSDQRLIARQDFNAPVCAAAD